MEYTNIGAWDIRITLDLFFGGIGVGAFLLSVLLSFYNRESHQSTIKIGAYTAPIAVGFGLLLLVAKLGVPSKFITTLWNVNLQSVMSIGVFLQTGFMILTIWYAILIRKKFPINNQFRLLQTIGTFFAFSTGLYHGLFLSSLGRVLWTELTPGMFIASSIAGGIAFVLLLETLINLSVKNEDENVETKETTLPLGLYRFQVMIFIILLVQLVSVVLWQFYTGRLELEQSLSYVYFMIQFGSIWTYFVLIGGIIIPMIITLISMIKHEEKMAPMPTMITCILILAGSFLMKHLLITGGQIALPVGFTF